jgi:hypothetical protein
MSNTTPPHQRPRAVRRFVACAVAAMVVIAVYALDQRAEQDREREVDRIVDDWTNG